MGRAVLDAAVRQPDPGQRGTQHGVGALPREEVTGADVVLGEVAAGSLPPEDGDRPPRAGQETFTTTDSEAPRYDYARQDEHQQPASGEQAEQPVRVAGD